MDGALPPGSGVPDGAALVEETVDSRRAVRVAEDMSEGCRQIAPGDIRGYPHPTPLLGSMGPARTTARHAPARSHRSRRPSPRQKWPTRTPCPGGDLATTRNEPPMRNRFSSRSRPAVGHELDAPDRSTAVSVDHTAADELLDRYLVWREQCSALDLLYRCWVRAPDAVRASAFAAFSAQLDTARSRRREPTSAAHCQRPPHSLSSSRSAFELLGRHDRVEPAIVIGQRDASGSVHRRPAPFRCTPNSSPPVTRCPPGTRSPSA